MPFGTGDGGIKQREHEAILRQLQYKEPRCLPSPRSTSSGTFWRCLFSFLVGVTVAGSIVLAVKGVSVLGGEAKLVRNTSGVPILAGLVTSILRGNEASGLVGRLVHFWIEALIGIGILWS